MSNDIHAAFEAKYKASAQDPACAEELRVFFDGWQARDAEIAALREDAERPKLTADQRTDLLAAALYISARDDDTAVLKSEDAERIADLLYDLSAIDIDAVPPAPQPPPFPWREEQKIARQIRGDGGKERKGC